MPQTAEVQLIQLVYRRDSRRETFTGTITTPDPLWSSGFSSLSFERMLELVGAELRRFPDLRLLIRREEAPYPMSLPPGVENLLRTDLPRAIEMLTLPPQRVVIGVPKKKEVAVLGTLRYGNDTLADAFGEEIYVKVRLGREEIRVEDPITGRLIGLTQIPGQPLRWGPLSFERYILARSGQWGTLLIQKLLAVGAPRYYLPRGWNPSGSWISHEDLAKLYDRYQKEKKDVH